MSGLISQFVPPHPLPLENINLFSTSVTLFLFCRSVHLYPFLIFQEYTVSYAVYLSLSNLTLLSIILSRSMHAD